MAKGRLRGTALALAAIRGGTNEPRGHDIEGDRRETGREPASVCRDLEWVRHQWRKSAVRDFEEARAGLRRIERVLLMVTFRFCSAAQPISVSEGARFSKPKATPWGTMSQYKRGRPNGPTVLLSAPELGRAADDHSPWPQGTQVAYQWNRLARWAEKRSAWAYGAPGRCPDGLGEPRAFGPGTYRVSRKKTGTLPTHSDPRSWVDFAQARLALSNWRG